MTLWHLFFISVNIFLWLNCTKIRCLHLIFIFPILSKILSSINLLRKHIQYNITKLYKTNGTVSRLFFMYINIFLSHMYCKKSALAFYIPRIVYKDAIIKHWNFEVYFIPFLIQIDLNKFLEIEQCTLAVHDRQVAL